MKHFITFRTGDKDAKGTSLEKSYAVIEGDNADVIRDRVKELRGASYAWTDHVGNLAQFRQRNGLSEASLESIVIEEVADKRLKIIIEGTHEAVLQAGTTSGLGVNATAGKELEDLKTAIGNLTHEYQQLEVIKDRYKIALEKLGARAEDDGDVYGPDDQLLNSLTGIPTPEANDNGLNI